MISQLKFAVIQNVSGLPTNSKAGVAVHVGAVAWLGEACTCCHLCREGGKPFSRGGAGAAAAVCIAVGRRRLAGNLRWATQGLASLPDWAALV